MKKQLLIALAGMGMAASVLAADTSTSNNANTTVQYCVNPKWIPYKLAAKIVATAK